MHNLRLGRTRKIEKKSECPFYVFHPISISTFSVPVGASRTHSVSPRRTLLEACSFYPIWASISNILSREKWTHNVHSGDALITMCLMCMIFRLGIFFVMVMSLFLFLLLLFAFLRFDLSIVYCCILEALKIS